MHFTRTAQLRKNSFDNTTGVLTISEGNTVTLPMTTGGDNWGSQVVETDGTLTGNGTSGNPLSVDFSGLDPESDPVFTVSPAAGITAENLDEWNEDNDATNELQSLSFDNGTGELTISDGNSVTLPLASGGDNWGSQVVQTDGTLSGNGTSGSPLSVDFSGLETFWYENDPETGINYDGRVGINTMNPDAALHVNSNDITIQGHTFGSSPNEWENVGVLGSGNTNNGPARGVNGRVDGPNEGYGVFGESSTDGRNVGIGGFGLSRSSNTSSFIGVLGNARSYWSEPTIGTTGSGNAFGGFFEAYGAGDFNIGIRSLARTENAATSNVGGEFVANSEVAGNIGIRSFTTADNGGFNRPFIGVANSGNNNYGFQSQVGGGGNFNLGYAAFMGDSEANNINAGTYIDIDGSNPNAEYYGARIFTRGNTENFNMGIYAEAFEGDNASFNAGVDGSTRTTGAFNVGVGGYATGAATADASRSNYGAYGYARAAHNNYGLYGTATFADAGVENNYGVYAEAANAPGENYAGYFVGDVIIDGDVEILGDLSKASGTFKIDHPLDPQNKYLVHSFVESPEMMNVYNGNITTDEAGYATVVMPDYFEVANKDFRYQLTVIGTFAQAIVAEEIEGNKFKIQTNEPNVKVSWQVTGVRNDPFANANRIEAEKEKEANKKGTYLHPELYGSDQKMYGKRGQQNEAVLEKLSKGEKIELPRDNEHDLAPVPVDVDVIRKR